MSHFISPIFSAGFSEMPPASKVDSLPTRATGGSSSSRPAVLQNDETGLLG